MRKLALVLVGVALLMSLPVPSVLAAPPWYDGPGGPDDKHLQTTPWEPFHRALATDGLIDPTGGSATGFITFVCESQEGFEYSVDVKGLAPGTYQVTGIPLANEPEWTPGGIILVTSVDYGLYPSLLIGTVNVNGTGEGEVEGVVGLPPGGYLWEIDVVDPAGVVILRTIRTSDPGVPPGFPGDHVGFFVYP